MRARAVLIGAVGVTLLCFGVGGGYFSSLRTEEKEPRVAYWSVRIAHQGASDAYAELARAVEHGPPEESHDEAHAFGAALYATQGLRGIHVCDDRFLYGCFHEFLTRATIDYGPESVMLLGDACVDALGAYAPYCMHGIGHGLIAQLGYTDAALIEALNACATVDIASSTGGCSGGAFMEYNLRGMWGIAEEPRALEDPQAPCTSLVGAMVSLCSFWQPQWLWRVVGGETVEDRVTRIGAVCTLFEGSSRDACFSGLGNVIGGSVGYMPDERSWCALSSADVQDVRECTLAALRRYSTRIGVGGGSTRVPATGQLSP